MLISSECIHSYDASAGTELFSNTIIINVSIIIRIIMIDHHHDFWEILHELTFIIHPAKVTLSIYNIQTKKKSENF